MHILGDFVFDSSFRGFVLMSEIMQLKRKKGLRSVTVCGLAFAGKKTFLSSVVSSRSAVEIFLFIQVAAFSFRYKID